VRSNGLAVVFFVVGSAGTNVRLGPVMMVTLDTRSYRVEAGVSVVGVGHGGDQLKESVAQSK